jgi:hypothetical protein
MIPPDVYSELLAKSLPELLKLYAAGKIGKDALGWVKLRLIELWEKKQYGFTPEPKIASGLQRINNTDAYRRTKECIGHNPYLNVIRLGLRIEELSENGRADSIAKMKNDVYDKYGNEGITILNMGSTGVLMPIIQHLSNIKLEDNSSQAFMSDYFKKVIENWKNITIFHQTEHGEEALVEKIKHYMDAHIEIFFVFSIGTAGDQAKKAISTLSNDGTIQNKGYMFSLISRKEDQMGRDHFSWIFKNIYNFDRIFL